MNRKIYIILLLGLLILFLNFNYGNNNFIRGQMFEGGGGEFGGAGASGIFGISADSGVKLTEKWESWGKNWKDMLMGNSFIKAVDSFFQKINFIFVILFGVDYSLSLSLFLIIVLWIFFFFMLLNVLGNTIFSKWVSVVISLGLSIGAAQIKLFQMPVNFLIGLFFGENPWWMKLIIGLIVFAILAVVFILIKNFGKQLAANKKKVKEEKNRLKLQTGAVAGEALSKAVSGRR